MRVEISIYAIKCGHESLEAESAATKDIAARKIRLIGSMSWESTAIYYQLLSRMVRKRQGGLPSVDSLLRSFDFQETGRLQTADDWGALTRMMVDAARWLGSSGKACLLICPTPFTKWLRRDKQLSLFCCCILAMLSPRQFMIAVLPAHCP